MTNILDLFPRPERLSVITLSHGEQISARILASLRMGINRVAGTRDRKMSPRSAFDLELDGIGGEIAYAQRRNVYFDFSVSPRSGGHDFIVNGLSADVKTTPNATGDLLVSASKAKNPCDIYVLMTGTFPEYTYRGFVLQQNLFIEKNLTDLNYGPTYLMPQSELDK